MKDRQPTRPGRVAITDELTGETRYATIEMADEPTEDGTPPTKPNLFDDTTMARFPAGVDTVNLALRQTVLLKDKATAAEAAAGTDDTKWMTPQKVQQAVGDKVGDLRLSKRSSLGDKYLLCNGAKVDVSIYPDLIPYLTHSYFYQFNKSTTIGLSSEDFINSFLLFKDNFVAVGYRNSKIVIYYKPVNGSSSFVRVEICPHYNGIVIAATDGESIAFSMLDSSYNLKIYYSKDLTTWNSRIIRSNHQGQGIPMIGYSDGNWYIWSNSGGYFFYTSSLNGTWSTVTNTSGNDKRLANGYVLGWYTGSGSSGTSLGINFTSISAPSTMKSTYLDAYFSNLYSVSLFSYQNYIIFLCNSDNTVNMLYFPKSSLDSWTSGRISFTKKQIVGSNNGYYPIGIYKQSQYWIIPVVDYPNNLLRIYGTTGDLLTGSYSQLSSVSLSKSYDSSLKNHFAFSENGLGQMAVLDNTTIKYSDPGYFLPTISVSGANTFIRAKE